MIFEEDFNNKNQLNKILKYVDKIDGEAIIDEKNKTINAKFSVTRTGDYMANDGFTDKQLEQLGLLIKPINDRLTNIENRLDVLEDDMKNVKDDMKNVKEDMKNVKDDIKAIKECPTIQKEIKKD